MLCACCIVILFLCLLLSSNDTNDTNYLFANRFKLLVSFVSFDDLSYFLCLLLSSNDTNDTNYYLFADIFKLLVSFVSFDDLNILIRCSDVPHAIYCKSCTDIPSCPLLWASGSDWDTPTRHPPYRKLPSPSRSVACEYSVQGPA